MKKHTHRLASALVALAALAVPLSFAACSGDADPVAVTGVTVAPPTLDVTVGRTAAAPQLTATVAPPNAANKKVTWESNKPDVATVDFDAPGDKATVRGVALGTATITAKTEDGGKTAVCNVKVTPPVENVTLSRGAMTVYVGGPSEPLAATVAPPDASDADRAVTWASDRPDVATVSSASGAAITVNAAAPGTATITATSAGDATKKDTCAITVAPLVAGVTVAPATLTLRPDGTKTLAAAVEPADALQSVVWASDAPSVATVVGDGLTATVTAVAVGTARITATSVGLPATVGACDVTVDTSPVTMAYATVAAGYDHTLAIKVDGSLWAWGRNQFGQLGLGDMGANRLVPTQVGEDKDWVSLSAGEDHTLAIRADGSLWAWGQNDYGQLGLGDNGFDTDRVVPTRVGFLNDWAAVATYYNHSLALKADGSLWAWGWGQDGQLGLGASGAEADRNVPTRVGTDSDWAAVAAGYYHTLAVKSDGSLWAWGENDRGQLGLGNSGSGTGRNVPTKVDAGSDWTTVSASFYHSLALKTGGGLYGWGFNSSGQLGLGDNDNRNVPTIVDTLDDLIAVRASNAHTLALKADGSVWAWGNNSYGQLGLSDSGPGTNRNLPNKVGMLGDWTSVATGSFHSMSHKVDGAIWAWGRNTSGQLGLGDTTNQNVPTKVGDGWRVPAEQSASGE